MRREACRPRKVDSVQEQLSAVRHELLAFRAHESVRTGRRGEPVAEIRDRVVRQGSEREREESFVPRVWHRGVGGAVVRRRASAKEKAVDPDTVRLLRSWHIDRSRELDGKVGKEEGKSLIDSVFAGGVSISENPEYVYAVTDSNGKLLFGVKKDGNFVWAKTDLLHTNKEINPEFTYAMVDSEGKTIFGLSNESLFRMFVKVRFEGGIDWTKSNLADLTEAL